MAEDNVGVHYKATGATIYAHIFDSSGKIADVTNLAFDTYATADIADYDQATTEAGTASRRYSFTFPSWILTGVYDVIFKLRAGGSPAEADKEVGAAVALNWDGSKFVSETVAIPEIAVIGDIPAAPTPRQGIMLPYMTERNDTQSTATERRLKNDAGTEVADAVMSDNGTTFSRGKLSAP